MAADDKVKDKAKGAKGKAKEANRHIKKPRE
jgi:hypothetical protein